MRHLVLATVFLLGCATRGRPATTSPRAPAVALPPTARNAPPAVVMLDAIPFVLVGPKLYVDAAATDEEQAQAKQSTATALAGLAAFAGTAPPSPSVVICKTDACELRFSGPTRRSHAVFRPRPTVIMNGIGATMDRTLLHEMLHLEVGRRLGPKHAVPTWFDEGVATYVSDNGKCTPNPPRALDDLRSLATPYAWTGFTNVAGKMEAAYCQARAEIAAWVEKHGPRELVALIDGVAAGGSFDALYGPLQTATPPAEMHHDLDASFALDENVGSSSRDDTGRTHIASLMRGAIWTTGKHGAAVKIGHGAHIRGDGFEELGIPDSPFSLSLWAKPLSAGNVLVHTAAEADGSGFCTPLLGNDAAGHLVAQINFAPEPTAFVSATGPMLPRDRWSHVAVTWSTADGLRLYVDGKLVATHHPQSPREQHRDASASPMYLFFGTSNGAGCWTGPVEYGDWNGVLDELHVYDYALDAAGVVTDRDRAR